MATSATTDLLVRILGDSTGIKKATADADAAVKGHGVTLKGLASTVAASYATAKIIQFGKDSVDAAMADDAAQVKLATTLRNTVGATDAVVGSVEDFISKMADATGVTDDEIRPAFARLVTSTRDVASAQDLLRLAMDISKGTGKDLQTVVEGLGKAHDGNVGALARLGLQTKDAEGKTLSFDAAVKNLSATFTGQAAAAAETNAGKMAIMKERYGELQEQIGRALIPIMSELVGAVSGLMSWFSSLDKGTQEWIIRLVMLGGGLLVASKAVTGIVGIIGSFQSVTTLAKKAAEAMGTSLTGMGLALGAVGLVIGAAVLAYQVYTGRKQAAVKVTNDLRDALTGEVGSQNKALAALAANSGAVKAFLLEQQKLGITTAELTQYVQNGTGPVAAMAAAWDTAKASNEGIYPQLEALARMLGIDVSKKGWDVAAASARDFIIQSVNVKKSNDDIKDSQKLVNDLTRDAPPLVDDLTAANIEAAAATKNVTGAYRQFVDGMRNQEIVNTTTRNVREFVDGMTKAGGATGEADRAYQILMGHLSAREAWQTAQEAIDKYTWTMADSTSTDAVKQQATIDLTRALGLYVNGLEGIPAEKKTEVYTLLDQGKIAEAEAAIAELTRARNLAITVQLLGQTTANAQELVAGIAAQRARDLAAWLAAGGKPYAAGGHTDALYPITVGERGSETFWPDAPGTIVPHDATPARVAAGDTYVDRSTTNHYWPPGVTPEVLVKARRRGQRRGLPV